MISKQDVAQLQGATLHGADGEKLGKIDTLYADRTDGEPTFAAVHTGLFGSRTSFVPLAQATLSGGTVTVPYTKQQVSSAPNVDEDQELSEPEEERLYAHYGLGTGTGTVETGTAAGTATEGFVGERETVGHDTSGPTTDDAMTRSEERLNVGTQRTEAGRARLRKYVVTEQVQQTVPVSHEEVRVEREPITEGNVDQAYDGPAISEEEHEVVLHAERPVVEKEAVPVERVRLDTETVTEQAQVTEEVRKEQIDTDGVYPDGTAEGTRERTDDLR